MIRNLDTGEMEDATKFWYNAEKCCVIFHRQMKAEIKHALCKTFKIKI